MSAGSFTYMESLLGEWRALAEPWELLRVVELVQEELDRRGQVLAWSVAPRVEAPACDPRRLSAEVLGAMTLGELADVVLAELAATRARGEPVSNAQRVAALLLVRLDDELADSKATVINLAAARRRRRQGRRA